MAPNPPQVSMHCSSVLVKTRTIKKVYTLYRIRWSCEPGNDLLSQQLLTDTLHDSRIQRCHLQVHVYIQMYSTVHIVSYLYG